MNTDVCPVCDRLIENHTQKEARTCFDEFQKNLGAVIRRKMDRLATKGTAG